MCCGCNYLLSHSTHFAERSHWIGGAGNYHFALVSSNVIKQMKDKVTMQVCMKEPGGGGGEGAPK